MYFYKWVVKFERTKSGNLTWGALLNFSVKLGCCIDLAQAIDEAKKILEQEQPQTYHLYRVVSARELPTVHADVRP